MSFHVFSPLEESACKEAITRSIPLTHVEARGRSLIVRQGRYKISLIIEPWGVLPNSVQPLGGIRSKINLYSLEPLENETPLQESMMEEDRLAEAVRDAIGALEPIEIWSGDGSVISSDSL